MAQYEIPEELVKEAMRVGHFEDPTKALVEALEMYIVRRARLSILDSIGTIDYDPDYDYKAAR